MTTVAPSAAPVLEGLSQNDVPRIIAAVVRPAASAAAAYLQIAAIKSAMPNPMGRPAYQKPGIKRVQKEMLHAAAIPSGPHRSASRNRLAVAASWNRDQRSQRPGFPMERWIQPTVWQRSMTPIPGPNSSKILPDSDHFGPSTSLTTSLPTRVRSALIAMPANAIIPSELARYLRKRRWS